MRIGSIKGACDVENSLSLLSLASITAYESACGRFTDYSLKHTGSLADLCMGGVSVDAAVPVFNAICAN